MRRLFKGVLWVLLFVLWLVVSVLLGGLVLSAKEALGINVFSSTGYHAFSQCLKVEGERAFREKERLLSNEKDSAVPSLKE